MSHRPLGIYFNDIMYITKKYERFDMKNFIKEFAWDEFAETLRKHRKDSEISQWTLALYLNISRSCLATAESKPYMVAEKHLLKIIIFLAETYISEMSKLSQSDPSIDNILKRLRKLCASKELDPYRLEDAWKLFKEIQEMKPAKTHVWVSAS